MRAEMQATLMEKGPAPGAYDKMSGGTVTNS